MTDAPDTTKAPEGVALKPGPLTASMTTSLTAGKSVLRCERISAWSPPKNLAVGNLYTFAEMHDHMIAFTELVGCDFPISQWSYVGERADAALSPLPVLGEGLTRRIHEELAEGDGFWRACSGCQEGVDGYVSATDYPYSPVFKCQPGGGCSECGGLGVKWDDTDYGAMGDAMHADMLAEEAAQADASQPGTQKPSGFGVDHENHEALREKVARIIDPLLFDLIAALDNAEGQPEQLRQDASALRDKRVVSVNAKADAILSVLQSGGGGQP